MPKVSLITLEYNSAQHTVQLLESLERIDYSDKNLQIVVVNTGEKLIRDYSSARFEIKTLNPGRNVGFTGGNNLGIQTAISTFNPDFFLLINNDTLVDQHFLNNLVHFTQSHKNVGVVSPLIYFAKGSEFHASDYSKEELGKVIWFAGGSIDWKDMYAFHRGVDEVDRGQYLRSEIRGQRLDNSEIPDINYETMDFATGCCMFIPAKVIESVGMFDDLYFLYWEDVDLSYRIKHAGYELYFCPESKIWHKNAGSSGGSGSSLHTKYQERNRLRFAMKYAPTRTNFALFREKFLR